MVVSLTSNGQHGDLHSGWSQEEDATPHIVGDSSGQTRRTSFTAQATSESDLLVGTELDVGGPFDSVGNVLDVSLSGDQVATSAFDVDSRLLPVRDFPPVSSGYPEAALDLTQRLYGAGGVSLPWEGRGIVHAYYPLRGYSQGFTVDGLNQPYLQGDWGRTVTIDGTSSASWYTGTCAAPPFDWIRYDDGVLCKSARLLVNPTVTGTNVNYVAFRMRAAASSSVALRINMFWPDMQATVSVRVNRLTGDGGSIDTFGTYRKHGDNFLTNVSHTTTFTDQDMTGEFGVVVQWGFLTDAVDSTWRIKAYLYDPANPPTGEPDDVHQIDLTSAMRAQLVSNNTFLEQSFGVTGFRDLILSQTGDWDPHYPDVSEPDLIAHDFTKTDTGVLPPTNEASYRPPVPAWSGSGWDYVKMLCTAHGLQARVDDGRLLVEELSTGTAVPVRWTVAPPQLSIQGSGRSRSVDVVAHKSQVARTFETDNFWDRVNLTVRFEETINHRIDLPAGEHLIGRVRVRVRDNDGFTVSQSAMWRAGARFRPFITQDGALMLTVRGPDTDEGIGSGPWRITEIRIANQGFYETPETITLWTGAPESMVTRDKGGTVVNPFLTTQGDVFTRGHWAAQAYGEPVLTLRFTVPGSHRGKYLPGSLVRYGYAVFRVMSVKHDRATSTVTASWFTTVDDLNAVWGDATSDEFAAHWAGRRALDGLVRPLSHPGVDYWPADDLWPADDMWPDAEREPFTRVYPSELKWSE